MKRNAGVLLAISSLPGEFGIGGFSHDAENFVTSILDMGFHWWQILPLNPLGYGDSPYSGISSMAGCYLYIDPVKMAEEGLIDYSVVDMVKYHGEPYVTNYDHARWAKRTAIEAAYANLSGEVQAKVDAFAELEDYWLDDYALYMSVYEQNHLPFQQWEKALREHSAEEIAKLRVKNKHRVGYYKFEQYLFFKQWSELKKFANSMGVGIIGDMPIYVSADSVDVWAQPKRFLLEKDYSPSQTAGLPPDYFSKTGHNWGNPLYDYDYMATQDYYYWCKKIGHALKLYDALRLDHFRGFYEYWSIPKGAEPSEGEWKKGPGDELFDLIKSDFPDGEIIAEDLGIMEDSLHQKLKATGFPGMKVMLFAFYDDESEHLPHNYPLNCVAYTGTHDNDTVLGWLYKAEPSVRDKALEYCGVSDAGWAQGGADCTATKGFITTLLRFSAKLVVVPIQDLCGFGDDCRMNVPGTKDGNWGFRLTYSALNNIDSNYFRTGSRLYGRYRGYKN